MPFLLLHCHADYISRMTWARYVAYIDGMTNSYKITVGKPRRKRSHLRSGRCSEKNTKQGGKEETGYSTGLGKGLVYSVYYGDEGTASPVSDVFVTSPSQSYCNLFSTYVRYSCDGGKFQHTYKGLFFRTVVYTAHYVR